MKSLRALLADIDRLLRGHYTRQEDLEAGRIRIPIRSLVLAGLLLGGTYGLFMGLFAVLRGGDMSWLQMVTTMIKVPLLFLLTLAVTFPSLYVFSALSGSKLMAPDVLRLLLVALGVNLALLASLGPVTGFFTLSTTSYSFMVVLNVIFFGAAGLAGLIFLARALERLFQPETSPLAAVGAPTPAPIGGEDAAESKDEDGAEASPPPSPRPTYGRPRDPQRLGRRVFFWWTVVFAIVGAQMGWILRPFIGSPGLPFELFRARESSFFEAILWHIGRLFT